MFYIFFKKNSLFFLYFPFCFVRRRRLWINLKFITVYLSLFYGKGEQEKESYANELESLAMSPSKKTKHLVKTNFEPYPTFSTSIFLDNYSFQVSSRSLDRFYCQSEKNSKAVKYEINWVEKIPRVVSENRSHSLSIVGKGKCTSWYLNCYAN